MFIRRVCASFIAAAIIAAPAERAVAGDAGAALGGLLLGAVIANEVNKNKRRKTTTRRTTTRRSTISTAQRTQNRQVQTALNYFGYNVGSADGVLGRNSRAGISRYQADMGFAPDGRLDPYERDFLLGSHQRAQASAHVAPYNQVVATQGYGGLLRTYRNEQLGIQTAGVQQPQVAPQPVPQQIPQATQPVAAPAPVPAPVPQPAPAPAPAATVAATAPAALPSFTFGQVAKSANEHCNEINVLTAANGGITTAGRVGDAAFALNEQFCLARTHAMAESTKITATIPNMTDAQVEQQCQGLAQVIAPQLDNLTAQRPDQVISATSGVLQGSGQPVAQLISGGKVCLGVGYRTDNAQMALASAVLLSSAGQLGYGEAVSHHMREGFGTAQVAPQQAGSWMKLALDAVSTTAGAAVMGQSPERVAVLQDAMAGGAPTNGVAALPAFPQPSNN